MYVSRIPADEPLVSPSQRESVNIAKAILLRPVVLLVFALLLLPVQGRKRVAVVLSGGGAKGMAHIGALKVIEGAGIPVDIVVGTSMGALVGGLYAIGYTPWQLDSLVRHQDWEILLSDKPDRKIQSLDARERSARYIVSVPLKKKVKESVLGGMIRGDNLAELFSTLLPGFNDSIAFDSLPVRFACVAADIATSREHVFHSGYLYTAMRASMAIPGVFTPVRQDSMVLVDGGLRNNFPVDVAKAMGADVVIGITVQDGQPKSPDELVTLPEILNQAVNVATRVKYDENVAMTDLLIRIPTQGYTTASYNDSDIDSLIANGERAAYAMLDSLVELRLNLGTDAEADSTPRPHLNPMRPDETLHVARIEFVNIKKGDARMARRKCGLRENSDITLAQIEQAKTLLRTASIYTNVSLYLTPDTAGYVLRYQADEQYEKNINLGAWFDSEEIATLLVNGRLYFNTRVPTLLEVSARLATRYGGHVSLTVEPTPMRRISLGYDFLHNDYDMERNGTRLSNIDYNRQRLGIELSDAWMRNVRYAIGARFEYFRIKEVLSETSEYAVDDHHPHFINYYARFDYDSFDRDYYPTRGGRAELGFTAYTDNFISYKGNTPLAAAHGSIETAIPLTSHLTLLPSLAARVLFGDGFPMVYRNYFGYNTSGRYLEQQIAFPGVNNVELAERYFATARVKFQQRIGRRHYVVAAGCYGVSSDELVRLFDSRQLAGVSLGYGYDSFIGPLEASFGYFNKWNKISLYVNFGIPF